MKKLILAIILLIATQNISAQKYNTIQLTGGYKAFGIDYQFQNEDFLNFGISANIVSADLVSERANKNDLFLNVHNVKSDIVPSLFGTVGATFDDFTMTGKFGAAYLEQKINNKIENQKLYFSIGIQMEYKQFVASFDNVNSAMFGYKFYFN